jgi:hypothetical protein
MHVVPPIPENSSPGRRWRFRRDMVIYHAHSGGFSQRVLADVFDLPRSRIGAIIAAVGNLVGEREGG